MEELLQVANLVANKLNSRFKDDPEKLRMLQGLKVQEEAGELAQAIIGALGLNPNKGCDTKSLSNSCSVRREERLNSG
ncbi:hypothetical protein [Streptomyces rubellomurinus]|uniref:Uncharacterized protein n=1 Tax=Streptomyces rubellomurinus (strain ATCC 31215) TaxID=359131 RepID=A0A0F2TFQ2_STRR3|nr:hypothetical protein [Streptomyces rubellomurinus]KJS61974.1 hypothetical protein VM95_11525 [Streptomyces rubellomurinus]